MTVIVGCGLPVVILGFVAVGFLGAWRARRRALAVLGSAAEPVRVVAPAAPAPVARWAAGCWGLWCGAEDSATWGRERAVQSLASWYGAQDAAGLEAVIAGLAAGQTGNVAWDVVRAVDLLRIGVAAGYLSEARCAAEVRSLATVLRGAYPSWEVMGAAFETGMNAWQDSRGITDENERGRVRRNLPHLRAAVWPTIGWTAPL